MRVKVAPLVLSLAACHLVCAEPTQITLSFSTSARCAGSEGAGDVLVDAAIYQGVKVGQKALPLETASTDRCERGDGLSPLGTLVLVPGTAASGVEVVVVAGVERPDGTRLTGAQCGALLSSSGGLSSFVPPNWVDDGQKSKPPAPASWPGGASRSSSRSDSGCRSCSIRFVSESSAAPTRPARTEAASTPRSHATRGSA